MTIVLLLLLLLPLMLFILLLLMVYLYMSIHVRHEQGEHISLVPQRCVNYRLLRRVISPRLLELLFSGA